jgi:DNA polymerase-3 subunit chi
VVEQIDFYVLGNVGRDGRFNYACRIAQKIYLQGLRVYIQTADHENSKELDALLWTFSQGSFVPHALSDKATRNWEDFPVQVGDGLAKNENADVLISLTDDVPENYTSFCRIAELVTDDPGEKAAARERYKFYRDQGIEPVTHKIT